MVTMERVALIRTGFRRISHSRRTRMCSEKRAKISVPG
jgi:hypothetical protein